MSDIETNGDDFVDILGKLTNFIQNERVKAYNEAVDTLTAQARNFMLGHGMGVDRESGELVDLLYLMKAHFMRGAEQPTGPGGAK